MRCRWYVSCRWGWFVGDVDGVGDIVDDDDDDGDEDDEDDDDDGDGDDDDGGGDDDDDGVGKTMQ